MDLESFEPGCVRRRINDGRPIRIVTCADGMVQYDVWQPTENGWGMRDLKVIGRKNISYYTTTVASLDRISTFTGREPLTPEEAAIHRPDLPFTAAHSETQAWSTVDPEHVDGPDRLPVAELFLRPFTATGSSTRMERTPAGDGVSFTRAELVRLARKMLESIPEDKHVVDGVGIHRLGIRQGLPSYYLWGWQWSNYSGQLTMGIHGRPDVSWTRAS